MATEIWPSRLGLMASLQTRPRCSTHRYVPLPSSGECLLCRGAKQAAVDRARAGFKPKRKTIEDKLATLDGDKHDEPDEPDE